MRIRKRTPARAADPGPSPSPLLLSASPLQRPAKERSREEEEEEEEQPHGDEAEEKRVILVAGVRDDQGELDGRVPAAAFNNGSAMDDDVPKLETHPQREGAAAASRCSRNDGKRWRCKSAAVPGYLFCERHIAWSTRKRKPRPRKHKKQHDSGGGVLGHPAAPKDEAASGEDDTPRPGRDDGLLGGFRKRAKGGGPGPAA